MSKKLTDQIVIRLEPELRAQIEAAATIERRPLANFVRNVLAERVANSPRLDTPVEAQRAA